MTNEELSATLIFAKDLEVFKYIIGIAGGIVTSLVAAIIVMYRDLKSIQEKGQSNMIVQNEHMINAISKNTEAFNRVEASIQRLSDVVDRQENTTQNYQWFTDEPEVVNHIVKTSGFANNKFDITEWDRDTRTISDYNVSNGEVKATRTYRIKEVEKVKTKRMALALRVFGEKEVFMVDRLFSTKEEAEDYFGKAGTVWPAKLANGTELSFDIPIEEN